MTISQILDRVKKIQLLACDFKDIDTALCRLYRNIDKKFPQNDAKDIVQRGKNLLKYYDKWNGDDYDDTVALLEDLAAFVKDSIPELKKLS